MNPTHVPAPLLCTGVPLVEENIERFVVSSDYSVQRSFCENGSSKLVEFRRLMSTVGFLLGLMTMAADIGGYTIIQRFEKEKSLGTTLIITSCWSIVISFTTYAIYWLLRKSIALISRGNDEWISSLERYCLLWSIIGVTGAYCTLDLFLLSTKEFFISVGLSIITIGGYVLLTVGTDRNELSVRSDVVTDDSTDERTSFVL